MIVAVLVAVLGTLGYMAFGIVNYFRETGYVQIFEENESASTESETEEIEFPETEDTEAVEAFETIYQEAESSDISVDTRPSIEDVTSKFSFENGDQFFISYNELVEEVGYDYEVIPAHHDRFKLSTKAFVLEDKILVSQSDVSGRVVEVCLYGKTKSDIEGLIPSGFTCEEKDYGVVISADNPYGEY